MPSEPPNPSPPDLEQSYQNLLTLWTSGVRDYNSLLSDYLTANSIFVAAIGYLLARQPATTIFSVLVLFLSVIGTFITLQMAILLGRFDAQNAYWEWRLRGIERSAGWKQLRPVDDYDALKREKRTVDDPNNSPATFYPNWAMRTHRQWWARRAISFPLFFAIIYLLFFFWSVRELVG